MPALLPVLSAGVALLGGTSVPVAPVGPPPVPPVVAPIVAPIVSKVGPICPGAAGGRARESRHDVRSAVLCLLNRQRARHGLAALSTNGRLARAGAGHARDM